MPIGRRVLLLLPLPIIRSPVVVTGDSALNAVALVVEPVPPDASGSVPVVRTLVDVAYTAPPEVNEVRFVPPLVVANVPVSVIAPVVAVLGEKPVVPALNDVTPPLPPDAAIVIPPALFVIVMFDPAVRLATL